MMSFYFGDGASNLFVYALSLAFLASINLAKVYVTSKKVLQYPMIIYIYKI